MSSYRISAIVLNWNDPSATNRCLISLVAALRGLPSEIIVVENGSGVDASLPAGSHAIDFKVLRHKRNLGVSAGRNSALRVATGDYILSVDDDAIMTTDVSGLLDFMDRNARVGVAGPRIESSIGSLMYTCRRFPTALDKLERRLGGWGRRRLQESELRTWSHDSPALVDYVIGACQFLRRAALEEVGLYDEKIFYGPEDVDLCIRMWEHGWQVAYLPIAAVIHDERRITRRPSILTLKHVLGLARFFRRRRYLFDRRALYERIPRPDTSQLHSSVEMWALGHQGDPVGQLFS
ncbi:MAG: glycosyltransferase family 2 protein [Actinomycetota bacterium]